MKNPNPVQVKAAFKLGYISFILQNELMNLKQSLTNDEQSDLLTNYLKIFLQFEKEYTLLFNDTYILFKTYKTIDDKRDFLLASVEIIKEKIAKLDNAKLETSFFAGGTLAISYDDDLGIFSSEMFSDIMKTIFEWCRQNSEDLGDQIPKVLSNDIYECMLARNTICHALIGRDITVNQKQAFRFLDKIVINKN